MAQKRPIKFKVYARAVTAILLIAVWSLVGLTGLLLWMAPSGQRAGQQILLLGITKSGWGDIHFWIGAATVAVTLIHLIIDWKALRGVIRYLTTVHRERGISV